MRVNLPVSTQIDKTKNREDKKIGAPEPQDFVLRDSGVHALRRALEAIVYESLLRSAVCVSLSVRLVLFS